MVSHKLMSNMSEQPKNFKNRAFDYMALSPSARNIVQQNAREIKSLIKRTAQDTINIGQKLIEAKKQLGHGYFENWLKAEFNWGHWTARKFMQVAREFESVNFTDLSIDISALYHLATATTPETVRREAIERARRGETITYSKVKEITRRHLMLISEASESFFDISTKTAEQEAFIFVETHSMSQVDDQSIAKEQLGNQFYEKKAIPHMQSQKSNCSHIVLLDSDKSDYSSKNQAEAEIQFIFGIGNLLCITTPDDQTSQLLGEVAEVTEVNDSDIKVVVKISLQSTSTRHLIHHQK